MKTMRTYVCLALALVMCCATFAACAETTSAHKNVITFAMCGSDDSYNPYNHNSNYGDIVYDMITDHLVYVAYDGSFEPRLADSWETNEDCTQMTFHLNHNVTWHAVSYTHLDVYKRQLRGRGSSKAGCLLRS